MKITRFIYAFAHAGGSSILYRHWKEYLKKKHSIELVSIDLPGRGANVKEPAIKDLTLLIRALADQIHLDLTQRGRGAFSNWATFGHSFGGVLSFAVAKDIEQHHGYGPLHSTISGSLAPVIQRVDNLHTLSDDEILARLRSDNGTPEKILAEPVMMRRVIANMRNDYAVRRQFLKLRNQKVSHPLLVLSGKADKFVTPKMMGAWKKHTTSQFNQWEIPGGHFSVYDHLDLVLPLLLSEPGQEQLLSEVDT